MHRAGFERGNQDEPDGPILLSSTKPCFVLPRPRRKISSSSSSLLSPGRLPRRCVGSDRTWPSGCGGRLDGAANYYVVRQLTRSSPCLGMRYLRPIVLMVGLMQPRGGCWLSGVDRRHLQRRHGENPSLWTDFSPKAANTMSRASARGLHPARFRRMLAGRAWQSSCTIMIRAPL